MNLLETVSVLFNNSMARFFSVLGLLLIFILTPFELSGYNLLQQGLMFSKEQKTMGGLPVWRLSPPGTTKHPLLHSLACSPLSVLYSNCSGCQLPKLSSLSSCINAMDPGNLILLHVHQVQQETLYVVSFFCDDAEPERVGSSTELCT